MATENSVATGAALLMAPLMCPFRSGRSLTQHAAMIKTKEGGKKEEEGSLRLMWKGYAVNYGRDFKTKKSEYGDNKHNSGPHLFFFIVLFL